MLGSLQGTLQQQVKGSTVLATIVVKILCRGRFHVYNLV